MKCKSCKKVIDDDSLFCKWCGASQIRKARERKAELIVPKPRKLKSGNWNVQLRLDGQVISITKPTEREALAEARAVKSGIVEKKKALPAGLTVGKALDEYIKNNDAVLSPATVRSYKSYRKNHYKSIIDADINSTIDWQTVINEEARECSPKYCRNLWAFLDVALGAKGVKLPDVNLPAKVPNDLPWLTYNQIMTFLNAVKGDRVELAAILALHSLRQSEILDVNAEDIHDNVIHVSGAAVRGTQGLVHKEANKNEKSQREIPIMIDRLNELVQGNTGLLVTMPGSTMTNRINAVCKKAGLPQVGTHGLRRSFASLCQKLKISERTCMALGGWSDYTTMHKAYIKLDRADIEKDVKKIRKKLNAKT